MSISEYIMIATFVITIGTMVWRIAILSAKVDHNHVAVTKAHSRIDDVKKNYSDRIDELFAQMSAIRDMQVRVEERLSMLMGQLERGTLLYTHQRRSDTEGHNVC